MGENFKKMGNLTMLKTKNFLTIALIISSNNILFAMPEYPISTVGIPGQVPLNPAARTTSYPYISADTFRCFCDFKLDETKVLFTPNQVKNGDTIFILNDKDFLDFFFQKIHPKINAKYILITHSHDKSEFNSYLKYLDDENLAAWFGVNMSLDHPKAFQIPIGIANNYWPHGNTRTLENAINNRPEKNILLYMNFSTDTNVAKRKAVFDLFNNKAFCYKATNKNYRDYLNDLARSKFVLSPLGNGLDCHRTWESIFVGSIPILESSKLDPLFEDLPVIIVKDWRIITEEFLNNKYKEMANKKYNLKKLYADYWFEKIYTLKEKIKLK